ncbi:flagellar assembly protein FliW [Lacisediminihabitans profunda]|uniref:Flagellar assembly protein FliW n=1 Tax=Lacisediminihabitans profunda TaxID=2594790 RepID=A0A5C8UPF8_9MICO|nr:flagellar assembly protein FliW [Lacisediminihabitans profunda]TXN29224.1 flagellar assembly protein FliW [Lacisediminihabitans profunda]
MSAALTFVTPPPGLDPLTDFTLTEIEGATGLYSLRAVHNDGIRLFVLDAAVFLPDYGPMLSDEHCAALGLTAPEDAMVLVVANPGEAGTRLNLMAPIVVNVTSGSSAQVILEDQDWSLQAELATASA